MVRTRKHKSHSGTIAFIVLVAVVVGAVAIYNAYNKWVLSEHPIRYSEYVERYAKENDIDKYLVYAVIKTESGYDSGAVSNVGARGLMQIMENTFDWIKFKLNDEVTQYHEMFIPEHNIRYGCYLLGYLYEEFGNIDATMAAYHAGVNYYDTAYIYGGSEAAIGKIFEKNGIREKIKIATKLPHYLMNSIESMEKCFQEELSRLRTDYIDYYLMHMLNDVKTWEKLVDMGILEWIKEKKESGAIRQIGFSYHGNSESFCKVVDAYDWDFCQIQYNYLDENA